MQLTNDAIFESSANEDGNSSNGGQIPSTSNDEIVYGIKNDDGATFYN